MPQTDNFFSIVFLYHSGIAKQRHAVVQYRLRLEFICKRIIKGEEVQLDDMIWANKLAKANRSAGEMLRKARRVAANPEMPEGGLDDFLNQMDLGDPDPSNHVVDGFNTVEDMVSWFKQDKTDDWRQRDRLSFDFPSIAFDGFFLPMGKRWPCI